MYVVTKLLRALGLILLIYAGGWALWVLFHRRSIEEGRSPGGLCCLFGQALAGIAANGVFALGLSLAGVFSIWSQVAAVLALLAAALLFVRPSLSSLRAGIPFGRETARQAIPVALIVLVGLILFTPPFMDVFGSWDVGVYPNIAANIRRTGGVFYNDPVLPTVGEQDRDLFYEDYYREDGEKGYKYTTLGAGFYVTDFNKGEVTPQFFYFFPAWLALGMGFLGIRPGFLVIVFFAAMSLWAFYELARELMKAWAAIAASLFLAVSFLQVYFSKYSTTEVMVQFFFLAGLFAYIRYRRERERYDERRWWGFLAATGFGCMLISRVDALVLFLPLLLLYLVYYVMNGRKAVSEDRSFLIPLSVFLAFTIAMCFGPYSIYVNDVKDAIIGEIPGGWVTVFVSLGALILIAWVLRKFGKGVIDSLVRNRKTIIAVVCLILVLAFVYALFLRPLLSPQRGMDPEFRDYNESSLLRLTHYLTPLGLILAVLGYCLFLFKDLDSDNLIIPLVGLTLTGLLIYRPMISPVLVYSMRRFVPVVLPLFMLMAGYALHRIYLDFNAWRQDSRIPKIAIGSVCFAICAVLLGLYLAGSVRIARLEGSKDSYPLTIEVSRKADDDALIVCDEKAGRMLAAPLRFIMGRKVVRLNKNSYVADPRFQRFVSMWQRRGTETFLVAVGGSDVLDHTGDFQLEKAGSLPYHTRILQLVIEKPVENIISFDVVLDIYKVKTR